MTREEQRLEKDNDRLRAQLRYAEGLLMALAILVAFYLLIRFIGVGAW